MIPALALYAIVAAFLFGWLLNDHLSLDRDMPIAVAVLLPLLWPAVLLAFLIYVVWALVETGWQRWRA